MKKFYYITNIRLPTEKAHGIQIMKTCEALAGNGVEVDLIVPNRRNDIKEDPFDYYKVKRSFKITRLWCLDLVSLGRVGFWIETITFAKLAGWYSLFKKGVFYTREEFLAFYLKLLRKNVVWESHVGHKNFFARYIIRHRVKLIVITEALKRLYIEMGSEADNILVAPDAVDIEQFSIKASKGEVRKKLNIPLDKKIVLYTGHLYGWKGVDTLAESAPYLDSQTTIFFVGGTEADLKRFRGRYGNRENIKILGQKPHPEMPLYMRAADILVLPNSAKGDISSLYTSPMKLFEYMASGVPMIVSDLPSIREILDESTAYFFEPDNPQDLAEVITRVLDAYNEGGVKARASLEKIQLYSWGKRAKSILSFIKR